MNILHLIEQLGTSALDILWLPIGLWSAMGLIALVLMKLSSRAHSVYQYHGRIALLFALPAGIFFSWFNHWIGSFTNAGHDFGAKLIVIQSPITVSGAAGNTVSWYTPSALAGLITIVAFAVALILLFRMAASFISLHSFSDKLEKRPLITLKGLSGSNHTLAKTLSPDLTIAFTKHVEVPFTFGWLRPVIVLPAFLQNGSAGKLNMAIRHELVHIQNHDYLLNTLTIIIKNLFWFHPLVYNLHNSFKEYREISCDSAVLSDNTFSRKEYAELLFELAPKRTFAKQLTVNMAINSSTLKKRIQIMSSQPFKPNRFKTKFYLLLASTLLMVGIIACSDVNDGGITNTDIENAQAKINSDTTLDSANPLYVINGAVVSNKGQKNLLARLKPKYIKSITVLKGQKAVDKYGKKGTNGVIEMQLLDAQKAFEDLRESAPTQQTKSFDAKSDFFVVVEKMPKLIGGMGGLASKIHYPEMARKAGIEGRVIVQFIVGKDGDVEDPHVIRGIGGGCDKEALRVVKQAKFEPGQQRGHNVRVQYSLPIVFKLPNKGSGQS